MSGHRILLADDDRLILSTLGQGLRDAGYEILVASDGNSAVHLCMTTKPNLAILDIRMPGLSGIEAARQIRESTETPVLFLSAYADLETVKPAIEEGALGYLVKPVDLPQIIPAIEAALARAAELKTLRDSERSLNTALVNSRETSMAVGLIMERYRLNREMAFEVLRRYSRSERLKIKEIANNLLAAADSLSIPQDFLSKVQDKDTD